MKSVAMQVYRRGFLASLSQTVCCSHNTIINSRAVHSSQGRSASVRDWSYSGDDGPEFWYKKYPSAAGRKQSPIDLLSARAVSKNMPALKLLQYKRQHQLNVTNLGTTVSFKTFLSNAQVELTKVHGTDSRYKLDHFHLHWGDNSLFGSEHAIDGKKFPMEIHFVHCLDGLPLSEASAISKGVAVLAFFYQISEDDNLDYTAALEALKRVLHEGMSCVVDKNLDMNSLLPNSLNSGYFWYSGSLTTPPCHENVQWIIFKDTIPISERQMNVMRSIEACAPGTCSQHGFMMNNWRPLQTYDDCALYLSQEVEMS